MVDDQSMPYVLPFNFGYENNTLYLHSAQQGKKIDILRQNDNVCIAFSIDHQMRHSHEEVACSYGMKFRSVLAYGKVAFVDDFDEKQRILNIVMKKYTGREFTFNAPSIHEVAVFKVGITEVTGKESGY